MIKKRTLARASRFDARRMLVSWYLVILLSFGGQAASAIDCYEVSGLELGTDESQIGVDIGVEDGVAVPNADGSYTVSVTAYARLFSTECMNEYMGADPPVQSFPFDTSPIEFYVQFLVDDILVAEELVSYPPDAARGGRSAVGWWLCVLDWSPSDGCDGWCPGNTVCKKETIVAIRPPIIYEACVCRRWSTVPSYASVPADSAVTAQVIPVSDIDDPVSHNDVVVFVAGAAPIPTLSEWAAIGMTLLLLTAGAIVFFRVRRGKTGAA